MSIGWRLIRCVECESLAWRDEMEIVLEFDPFNEPEDIKLPGYVLGFQPAF